MLLISIFYEIGNNNRLLVNLNLNKNLSGLGTFIMLFYRMEN